MIACPTLRNSQVTAWQAKSLHVFTSLQYCCFPYCFCLSCAGVDQSPSTFWSATQSLLVGYQATIPPFEEDTQGFHRTPIAWLSVQLFLHKKCHELLNLGPLVKAKHGIIGGSGIDAVWLPWFVDTIIPRRQYSGFSLAWWSSSPPLWLELKLYLKLQLFPQLLCKDMQLGNLVLFARAL